MPPLKYSNKILQFINKTSFTKYLYFLRYRTICASMSQNIVPPNLSFLTWKTQNFIFYKFLPQAYFFTQIQPKKERSQFDPHLDYETGAHILFMNTAWRCFDFSHYILVALWAPFSSATSNHLKSAREPHNAHNLAWHVVDGTASIRNHMSFDFRDNTLNQESDKCLSCEPFPSRGPWLFSDGYVGLARADAAQSGSDGVGAARDARHVDADSVPAHRTVHRAQCRASRRRQLGRNHRWSTGCRAKDNGTFV